MATSLSDTGTSYEGISLTELLQNCFACSLFSVDARGHADALTPQGMRLLAQLGAEMQSPSSVLPPQIRAVVDEARNTGRLAADREIQFQPPRQPMRKLSVTAIPLPRADKTVDVILLLNDVSSVGKIEQHLQRLDRLASIGTLAASMAHEVKNALVPVKTFVSLLLEKTPEAELAGTVHREVGRVDALVSRMLKFAAPAQPAFATVHIHELIEHSLHLVQHRVEGREITFQQQFLAPSDACSGDDYQLEQVFVNLLLNAVEATGPQGTITIKTGLASRNSTTAAPQLNEPAAKTSFLSVEITDTGVGIPPEKLGSIFDPFFTTKPHGTGLGLAVTRRIIEEHHGVIRVKSEPGKGSMFTVLLPAG